MINRDKVIKGLESIWQCVSPVSHSCNECPYKDNHVECKRRVIKDALELLKVYEARHRLEVHNIGNVDIPEGVTWEQFQAVMNNVVDALEHTDRGESWPYEEAKA